MAESKAVAAKSWRSDIEGMKDEFARHLRTPVATERFTRTLVTALHGNSELVNADRLSLKIAHTGRPSASPASWRLAP